MIRMGAVGKGNALLTKASLHAFDIWIAVAGHGDGHEEDADHDFVRGVVWASIESDAVGGCGARVWGCGDGGAVE